MPRFIITFIIVFIAVGAFLGIRKLVDRQFEKRTDKEVVREGEEYLGTWASKSANGFIQFRLHRDGKLTYTIVPAGKDTTIIRGNYEYAGVATNDPKYFPRLYTFNEKGDTLFNYYVRYLTGYDMTIDKVDKMILSPNSVFDTVEYTFYRIKQ